MAIRRWFNIISIGALLALIFFVTAFFFLGSQVTFQNQRNHMPEYFLRRAGGGMMIGLLGGVIVGLGNLLLDRWLPRQIALSKLAVWTVLLSAVTSATGTAIFFFYQ